MIQSEQIRDAPEKCHCPNCIFNFLTKPFMSIIEKLRDLTLGEPHKTFKEVGVCNSNKTLTEEGREVYLNYLFSKETKDGDFFKECKKLLEEEKEKNKN